MCVCVCVCACVRVFIRTHDHEHRFRRGACVDEPCATADSANVTVSLPPSLKPLPLFSPLQIPVTMRLPLRRAMSVLHLWKPCGVLRLAPQDSRRKPPNKAARLPVFKEGKSLIMRSGNWVAMSACRTEFMKHVFPRLWIPGKEPFVRRRAE